MILEVFSNLNNDSVGVSGWFPGAPLCRAMSRAVMDGLRAAQPAWL